MKWIQPQAFFSYSPTNSLFQKLLAPPAVYQGS